MNKAPYEKAVWFAPLAALQFLLCLGPSFFCLYIFYSYYHLESSYKFFVIAVALLSLGWIPLKNYMQWADQKGVYRVTIFKKIHIPWDAVESCEVSANLLKFCAQGALVTVNINHYKDPATFRVWVLDQLSKCSPNARDR